MTTRLTTLAVAMLLVGLLAPVAQAGSTCKRSRYGISCKVWFQNFPSDSSLMRFGIRNNYGPGANLVETDTGWLDGTNDTSKRTWHGHLGRRAWRGRYKLWRACTTSWRPSRYACTGWVWQGPAPFGR